VTVMFTFPDLCSYNGFELWVREVGFKASVMKQTFAYAVLEDEPPAVHKLQMQHVGVGSGLITLNGARREE